MANIPATFAGTDNRVNILRAALLLQSVAVPAAPVAADANQGLVKLPATAGARGWFDAFRINQEGTQIAIHAELPVNPRIYGSFADLRKAIQGLPTTTQAVWNGAAGGSAAPVAASLEQALYDMVMTAKAGLGNGESITHSHKVSAVTGRSYLEIDCLFDGNLETLLGGGGSESQG